MNASTVEISARKPLLALLSALICPLGILVEWFVGEQ